MSRLILALFAALLLIPAADYQLFPGLPLSRPFPFAALLLLVPFLVSSVLRVTFARFVRRLRPAWRLGLVIAGAVALVGKLSLLASGSHAGFLACYGTPAVRPPVGPCERAYANPFGRFGRITRLDRAIDFGPSDWNLSFLNALRFNYYPWIKGNILRDHFPFTVRWTGLVEGPTELKVSYAGQATISMGKVTIDLPPNYGLPTTVPLRLPAERQPITIDYSFDDGVRSGEEGPVGPWATFRMLATTADGHLGSALSPIEPQRRWRGLAYGVDAAVLALAATLGIFYATLLAAEWWVGALAAVPALAAYAGRPAAPDLIRTPAFLAVLALLLGRLLARPRARVRLAAFFAAFYVAVFMTLRQLPGLNTLVYRSPGNDWLTYESYAREILENWSLRAGESVFQLQPLFRYIRFGERFLLGDGDLLVSAFALGALYWAILWTGARLWRGAPASPRTALLFGSVWALLLLLASSGQIATFIQAPLTEYPTWIFLLLVVPMLLVSRGREWTTGVVLLGLAVLVRTNHALAAAGMLGIFLVRMGRPRTWAAARRVIIFVAIAALPLLHNLYYGGQWTILPTQRSGPETLILPPARLLSIGHDPEVRQLLWAQVRQILALAPIQDRLLRLVFHGLLIAWAGSGLLLWFHRRRGSPTAALLLILPFLYLGVYVSFVVETYYPRHIVAGYLAMGVVALYAIRDWGGWGDAAREAAGGRESGLPRGTEF